MIQLYSTNFTGIWTRQPDGVEHFVSDGVEHFVSIDELFIAGSVGLDMLDKARGVIKLLVADPTGQDFDEY